MKWTLQKPTSTGYYWMRDTKEGVAPEVVEVKSARRLGFIRDSELAVYGDPIAAMPKTTQWAGPIAAPKEPTVETKKLSLKKSKT